MKLNQLKKKGFTLVEILIVVIIVGLLAGIAVSKLGDSKERAVISVKKSAAAELNKAIQTAYVKGNIIATAFNTLDVIGVSQQPEIESQFTISSLTELRKNITDPTPNTGVFSVTGSAHRDAEVVYTPPAGF
jgi:type IV pilus assembly protein PilA